MISQLLACAAILVIMLLISCPFYLSLLVSGAFLTIVINGIPASTVISGFGEGVYKISLVAVPFYMLAGSVMQHTSIGRRLIDAIMPMVSHMRGGVALTGVLSNEVFGAMSGSSPAAVGTIGRVMMPMVIEENGEKTAYGLFASAGSLAIIMPPSINMIIFGAATNTSTGALFIGGIIPSILITIMLAIYIIAISKKKKNVRFDMSKMLKGLYQGVCALALPVIILGGIYTGIFTPTEAGVVSAVYVILAAIFLGEMSWKVLFLSLKESIMLTSQIFILIAASTVFSQGLALTGIPKYLASVMGGLSPIVFLVILNIILLIAGCFFEPGSAIIILAPVLVPIGTALGLNPVHLGLVFTINLAIGMFTPPFGFNLFVIQSIFKQPLEKIARSIIPFLFIYIAALLMITYIPSLVTWLPRLAGY